MSAIPENLDYMKEFHKKTSISFMRAIARQDTDKLFDISIKIAIAAVAKADPDFHSGSLDMYDWRDEILECADYTYNILTNTDELEH